ncbi:acyltransferase [Actinomyces israelii]|uniref:Acyltransferase n=1 Tax=Actinomyces israelii TaxID=1659 RepID=A0ABT4IBM5_9ACTO|nr:acyltransferase [Actinomyces israelii]MCZ0859149.1 acyltransferase [Actinomyces israelii]
MPSSPPPSRPGPSARLIELDGLRGLAAVIVVIHHCLLTVPAFARIGAWPGVVPEEPAARILTQTPLHLLWAGHEAVLVFFVLSGTALVYPVARRHAQRRRFDWIDYVPRRIVRLWLPAAASTALAVALMVLVPRSTAASLGPWMTQAHPAGLSARHLLLELALQPRYAYRNTVLWSLHAEAVFSFLLPLVVLVVALAARARAWWLPAAACLAVPAVTGDTRTLVYVPVFVLGATAGWRWGHLGTIAPERPAPWATPAALACLVLITIGWWPGLEGPVAGRLAAAVSLAAVAALVALAVRAGALRGVLRSRAVQYLGALSFSLYLVHEPVIVATRLLMASWSPWLVAPVAVAVTAPLTWLFRRYVEAPSHRLSRRAGQWVSSRVRRTAR